MDGGLGGWSRETGGGDGRLVGVGVEVDDVDGVVKQCFRGGWVTRRELAR
jgi:hypothetical protein